MKRYLYLSVLLVACAVWRVGTPLPKRVASSAKGRGGRTREANTAPAAVITTTASTTLGPRFRIVLAALPEVRALANERSVDFAPRALLEASERLGRLHAELRANPELAEQGLEFYRECAREEDVLTSVRAYCLRAMRDLSLKVGHDVERAEFTASIWALADRIPSLD